MTHSKTNETIDLPQSRSPCRNGQASVVNVYFMHNKTKMIKLHGLGKDFFKPWNKHEQEV